MGSAIKTRLLVSQSDEQLLALAQHGCEIAFETLARRYRRPLLRHCRQLCLSEERAQAVLQRTFSEAWSGLQGQTQPVELQPWLRGIAQQMAAEAICPPDSATSELGNGLAAGSALSREHSPAEGTPTPQEVLALRGALAAISPLPQRNQVFMRGRNGNNSHAPHEDPFEIADSAVRGLLGRARRGISALTPPPLLAWLAGKAAQGGAGSDRIAELGGGGGAAGLTGLAVKGAIAALSAGVAITGAVIATSKHPHSSHASRGVVAASGAGRRSAPGGSGPAGAGSTEAAAARGGAARRRDTRTQRSRTERRRVGLSRSGGVGSSVTATRPTSGSTVAPHVNSSHPLDGRAPASSGAAAPQSAGAAQSSAGNGQATGGAAGTPAPGGSGSTAPPPGASGQPAGSGESSGSGGASQGQGGGIGVQVSVETGSGSQTPSSGSTGSTGSESHSGGTGVGISVSLEPIGSVGVHISLP